VRYPCRDEYARDVRQSLRAALLRTILAGFWLSLAGCGAPTARDARIVSSATSAATQPPTQNVARVAPAASRRYVVVPERSRVLILAGSVLGEHPVEVARYHGSADVVEARLHRSQVSVTLELDSVTASSNALTNLIKSERVLDVQRYPTASFVSDRIVPRGTTPESYRLTGTLTLHGVSKTVEVLGGVQREGKAFVASSRFSLRRQEFGIKPGGLLGLLIRDAVVVDLRLVAEPIPAP
jgi:polyisoprenoid-binding protein YceI